MSSFELRDLMALVLLAIMLGAAIAHRAWIRRSIGRLESDPDVQFQVHRWATWYWVVNFPIVAIMFFGFPDLWVRLGLLLNTFYSLYANLATDYGAVSAAIAAGARPQATCRHCRERAA